MHVCLYIYAWWSHISTLPLPQMWVPMSGSSSHLPLMQVSWPAQSSPVVQLPPQLEIACVRKGRLERMKRRKRAKKWKYKFKVAMWIIFNYLWIVWGLCGSVIYNVFDVDGCRGGWYWCECMLHSMWNLSAFNITAWTTYQGTIFFLSKEGKGAINLHKTTKMISQAFYLVGKKKKD